MNCALRCILLLTVTSCGSSTTGGAPPEEQQSLVASSDASAVETAPSTAPNASATATALQSASSAPVDAATARLELPAGALFAYREGNITLSFASPNHVTLLVPSYKACAYELGGHGNMFSGKEVEAAWKNAEAQNAVASSAVFLSPYESLVSGEVVGANGRIVWTAQCGGLCLKGPPGVNDLLRVLHVVAINARAFCKV